MILRTHLLPACVLLSVVLASPELGAQQQPTLVVQGGHIFDSETGVRRELGQLWISGDIVLAERAAGSELPELPEGVEVIDATGLTLVPGLFDLHCHVSVPGGPMSRGILLAPARNLASQLYCGVTHAVDLHADESTVFALREAARDDPGQARLYTAGAAFTAPGGHATQFGTAANEVTTVGEVEQRFERLAARHPDVIKGIQEHGGWGGLPELPTISPDLLGALGALAREAGIPFFCHIWTREEAATAVDCGADALAHGVFEGELDDSLIQAMRASGTAYIPTLSVVIGAQRVARGDGPYDRESLQGGLDSDLLEALNDPDIAENPAATWAGAMGAEVVARALSNLSRVFDAGLVVGLGTDAGNPLTPHGPAAIAELELYVEAGLSAAEALQCATLQSARILRVDDRFGSLAPGKIADIVLVRGDPTADISCMWEVEQVLKAGVIVDREAIRNSNLPRTASLERLVAGVEVGERIDAFEDGEPGSDWGGAWVVFTDSVAGGKSVGELAPRAVDAATLKLNGSVNEGFQYGAWSGLVLNWSAGGTRVVDASTYSGLRIRVRGTPRPYTFTVQRAAVHDFNVFATNLEIGAAWAELEIPFSSLRQIGYGKPLEWAADDLTGLNLDARNSPFGGQSVFGEFELELDWVRLYR